STAACACASGASGWRRSASRTSGRASGWGRTPRPSPPRAPTTRP
ncbi:hypothetical protein CFC21_025999, partial [Triticum aestivum]